MASTPARRVTPASFSAQLGAPPLSVAERVARGRAARTAVPRAEHATWTPPARRADPVALLDAQNRERIPWLVPIRHGRMMASPFAFFRGAARVMAADLAVTPVSGLAVQACGDAHHANFGIYASPERQLVFDVNDFDETLPGPWEWDLKRLAASFMIACHQRGFDRVTCDTVTARVAAGYRTAMAEAAAQPTLQTWYDHLTPEQLQRAASWSQRHTRDAVRRLEQKARSKDSLQALRALTVEADGGVRIRSDPPVLIPLRDLTERGDASVTEAVVRRMFAAYARTLSDDRRVVLSRFRLVDVALKVVGVGSSGTRCYAVLLEGRDSDDPLFLQVKQATRSVLEEHLPASRYRNQGQRVVEGQRLTQAVSDILLGWSSDPDGHDYYVRQLRDWKGSIDVAKLTAAEAADYAHFCGWTLSRGHARSGDPVAIAAYLGRSDAFDAALTSFSRAYAHQNEADYAAFLQAIRGGRLSAEQGR